MLYVEALKHSCSALCVLLADDFPVIRTSWLCLIIELYTPKWSLICQFSRQKYLLHKKESFPLVVFQCNMLSWCHGQQQLTHWSKTEREVVASSVVFSVIYLLTFNCFSFIVIVVSQYQLKNVKFHRMYEWGISLYHPQYFYSDSLTISLPSSHHTTITIWAK